MIPNKTSGQMAVVSPLEKTIVKRILNGITDAAPCRYSTEIEVINRASIMRTVEFIHKNFHKPFGLDELYDLASMPRDKFEFYFRDTVGITPNAFIERCRVERATFLLRSVQNRSFAEIATLSGFSSPREFRQIFLRLVGIPPSEYPRRQKIKSRRTRTEFGKSLASKATADRLARR
jgi:AraC family transcriptional regulator